MSLEPLAFGGLAVVLVFIGVKMLASGVYHIPIGISLGVVAYGEHEPERLAAVYWLLSGATFLVEAIAVG